MTTLIASKIRDNDGAFFKIFTRGRARLEKFLIENKSLLGIVLQNMSRAQRVPKMSDLFQYLIAQSSAGIDVKPEAAMSHIGVAGRIFDLNTGQASVQVSDDAKSIVFVREAISAALRCPECNGLLHPTKSISYDHILRAKDGGTADANNIQMTHPFCNSAIKN
jgi:hypothetical protein